MQRAGGRHGGVLGFSTAELTVSLVLMGIALAVGVQRVDSTVWKLDAAARDVAQRARMARALAVLKQHNVILTFDAQDRVVILHEDSNNDGQVSSDERLTRYYLEKGISFTLGSAPAYADYGDDPITFYDASVTFLRNGSASEEGAVYIAKQSGYKARAVVIARATGYTQMRRYNGSGWNTDD